MDNQEYILEQILVVGQARCSLFGKKQYVYFYLNYTSKARWEISLDTPQYDPTCKCYEKDLNSLFHKEIEQAKEEILQRIKIQHTVHKMAQINKLKINQPLEIHSHINLMKHKDIKIKDIDWKD